METYYGTAEVIEELVEIAETLVDGKGDALMEALVGPGRKELL